MTRIDEQSIKLALHVVQTSSQYAICFRVENKDYG